MKSNNEVLKVKFKKLYPDAKEPVYARSGDAGADLFAYYDFACDEEEGILLSPGESTLVPTGIALALPPGYEAQVRPRSGLALNHQVTVLNTPGTVDSGYRGEIGVILINHSKNSFHIKHGMKIAQIVIKPVPTVVFEEVGELDETERGTGGFGHTGYKAEEALEYDKCI